jgi:hypothetical protein
MACIANSGEDGNRAPPLANTQSSREEGVRDLVRWLEMSWNSRRERRIRDCVCRGCRVHQRAWDASQRTQCNRSRPSPTLRHSVQGQPASYLVEKLRFVRPDVVLAFLRQRFKLQDGKVLEARPTLTLARQGERWQIVALQNTLVAEKTKET